MKKVTKKVAKKPAPEKRTRKRTPNNPTTTGFRVSDELWAVLEPLLPVHVNTHRFGGGRPRVPDRPCADAIFYVLRTGGQWESLNQTDLCAKSTAHDRFRASFWRSGKPESRPSMKRKGSTGTGYAWTER
jgi:putative transposase